MMWILFLVHQHLKLYIQRDEDIIFSSCDMMWILFLVHQRLKLYMRHDVDIIFSSSALETLLAA